jgi:hypothetical protein
LKEFEYDLGPIGDHQVEVKVETCGICHSDVSMIDNIWGMTSYPFVPVKFWPGLGYLLKKINKLLLRILVPPSYEIFIYFSYSIIKQYFSLFTGKPV